MLRLVYRNLILDSPVFGTNGAFAIIEAERRPGDALKFEAEVRLFLDVDDNDRLLGGFRRDSIITLRLARYL